MSKTFSNSPLLEDRELSTYKFDAKVTLGDICCCTANTIDIAGLTVAALTASTFSISGFEALADISMDSSRPAGFVVKATGTLGGVTAAEYAAASIKTATISGTAGSRIITVTHAAAAFTWATDTLTGAVVEFSIPIKAKDF